ncbi:MAG: class II glutamine amidotransferase, partial [Actinomycetota bacterium]|nr:class II glutamine amidotransferase [Actinomycetota bacterium]
MCRIAAYVGAAKSLEEVLVAPEHSLYRQAWAPRTQQSGTVNADGFGVGWYDTTVRAEPALYRTTIPMWSDRSFAGMAGLIRSHAVMGAVRGATEPVVTAYYNVPPFGSGRYLFAH